MPLYTYQCPHCGTKFERLVQKMDDHTDRECPQCHTPSPITVSVPAPFQWGKKR